MYPLVVIKSFGKEKCGNIIKEILRINDETVLEPMNISIDSYKSTVYKLSIRTKYYKTQVLLYECKDISSIPNVIKNKIEGAIFYFDSNDTNFVSELEALAVFIRSNNIGVATLITHNLNDNNKEGLSYDVVKNICKHDINIIDLNAKFDNEEPDGYAEVLDMLKNNVWSSVHISNSNTNNINNEGSDVNIEDALSEFEDLLNKFQQFKAASQNMSREEVLQNAENLAELFANMLNED